MTDTIALRPMTREEYHAFFRSYVADPNMSPVPYRYQYTHVDRNYDFDQARADWYPTFGIFLADEPIGCLSLKRIDREKQRCEIGLMVRDDSWKNRGFGTAAMLEGIRMAREDYGVRLIIAETLNCNARMQHVLAKLGFVLKERRERAVDMGDRLEDQLVYWLEGDA